MIRIVKRLCMMLITMALVSFLVYASFELISGDQATSMLGIEASEEAVAALREDLGLDRPFLMRFFHWAVGFIRGDMGHSYVYNMEVSTLLGEKLVVTSLLTGMAFTMVVLFAMPIAFLAAKYQGRGIDYAIRIGNQIAMAIPPFFLGIMLTYVFGLMLHLFTPGNYISYEQSIGGFLGYLVFPALAIALPKCAMTVQILRGALEEEIQKDYVRTAYSKGNTWNRVLLVHVCKNVMIPTITFLGMVLTEMLIGSIIIEQVFGIPGVGSILLQGISKRDYPLIQAIIVCLSVWVLAIQTIVELLYHRIDPRVSKLI